MEQEIVNKVLEFMYKDRIAKSYENREDSIDFPIHIDLSPNMKVIIDFNNAYFYRYENTLVENAAIYALEKEIVPFLKYFKDNVKDLKKAIQDDQLFRLKVCEYGIKNLLSRLNNRLEYSDEKNHYIKNKYNDFFNKIKLNYISYFNLCNYYRKLLSDFLKLNKTVIHDEESFLEDFLYTNHLDKLFMVSTDFFINEKNIKKYKNILKRIILGDNYINTELELFEEELFNNSQEENEYIDDLYKVIYFLENCIDKNIFELPKDYDLRFMFYTNYLVYNTYADDKKDDIKAIESNQEKKLKLKKINPLYKCDLLDLEID